MKKQTSINQKTIAAEDENYLDTPAAAAEADREARRRAFKFKPPKGILGRDSGPHIVDRRNKYGTGSVAYIIKEGFGRVVNYIEDYPTTTYPIRNGKAHGNEVTCDAAHKVLRRWEDGKMVPLANQNKKEVARPKRGGITR